MHPKFVKSLICNLPLKLNMQPSSKSPAHQISCETLRRDNSPDQGQFLWGFPDPKPVCMLNKSVVHHDVTNLRLTGDRPKWLQSHQPKEHKKHCALIVSVEHLSCKWPHQPSQPSPPPQNLSLPEKIRSYGSRRMETEANNLWICSAVLLGKWVGILGEGWLKGHGLEMFQITNFWAKWAPRSECRT